MSNDMSLSSKKKKKSGLPGALLAIIVLGALGAGAFMLFRDMTPPTIAISPATEILGKASTLSVKATDTGSGLKSLLVTATQDGKRTVIWSKEFPAPVTEIEEEIPLADGVANEGEFIVDVTAEDTSLYPFGESGVSRAQKTYTLDLTPPRIYVQSHTNNLNQGGCGLLVFALSEKASTAGIQVGKRFFPAYEQPGHDGKIVYYCMFAHPWDVPASDFKPFIVASDSAGNSAKRSFNYHTNPRNFRQDRINLSDSFFEKTIPEFQGLVQDNGSLLDQYLFINKELRKANRAKLVEFSRQTSSVILWSGVFKRLPNAANRARFADARDYMYKGKKVDHQTHLGLDLASLRNADVPAANDGKVVYADFLGIYGNVVVIDHGLGLQTLYAHLSSAAVAPGDVVTKGQKIGNTGATGLAGGDHLHYGVIVAGIPTQPQEWFDDTWIKNNITSKTQ